MAKAKTATALAVTAVATAAGMTAIPAGAATTTRPHGFVPRPAPAGRSTPFRCTTSNNVKVCGQIFGFSNFVSSMDIQMCVLSAAGQHIHGEIVSPDGGFINTPSYFRSHGNCTPLSVAVFDADVVPGTWEFRAWRKNTNGTFTKVAQQNLTVDP
jgi:hypothetical protein